MSNNPKTPQHAFYIGDNVSEDLINTYQDSLVFDRERNSIYAKNHEFGYISDFNNSIKLRNADNTNSTTITLSVVNGQISFYEYRTPILTLYKPNYEISNTLTAKESNGTATRTYTMVLGGYAYIPSINVKFSGSDTVNNITVTNVFANPDKVIYESSELNLIENSSKLITFDNYVNNTYISSTTPGSHTILSVTIQDNHGESNTQKVNMTFYNNIMLYKWAKDSNDFYGLKNIINEKTTLEDVCSLLGNTTLYNNLVNSHIIGTINCNNGPNEYLALCCPSRVNNSAKFTGILGGAAVQEFEKVKTVTYTNSANYTENYNIYLATGHNWAGQSLKI